MLCYGALNWWCDILSVTISVVISERRMMKLVMEPPLPGKKWHQLNKLWLVNTQWESKGVSRYGIFSRSTSYIWGGLGLRVSKFERIVQKYPFLSKRDRFWVPAILPLEIPCPNAQWYLMIRASNLKKKILGHWALGQGISRGKTAGTRNFFLSHNMVEYWVINIFLGWSMRRNHPIKQPKYMVKYRMRSCNRREMEILKSSGIWNMIVLSTTGAMLERNNVSKY